MKLKQPIAFLKKKELTVASKKKAKQNRSKSKKMRGFTNLKMQLPR